MRVHHSCISWYLDSYHVDLLTFVGSAMFSSFSTQASSSYAFVRTSSDVPVNPDAQQLLCTIHFYNCLRDPAPSMPLRILFQKSLRALSNCCLRALPLSPLFSNKFQYLQFTVASVWGRAQSYVQIQMHVGSSKVAGGHNGMPLESAMYFLPFLMEPLMMSLITIGSTLGLMETNRVRARIKGFEVGDAI